MKRRRAAEGENDQNKGGELSDLESNLGRPFVGFFGSHYTRVKLFQYLLLKNVNKYKLLKKCFY